MAEFETMHLPAWPTVVAPDGSDVRVLLRLGAASMAHFSLAPRSISKAVRHRTVEEIWYVVGGRGRMWRRQDGRSGIVDLVPGTCLTIPLAVDFQFRSDGSGPLEIVGITMPPWPGHDEAILVEGCPDWS
jgi:mannose-6-phosphate isomerase-like protein (cupin superfamily)